MTQALRTPTPQRDAARGRRQLMLNTSLATGVIAGMLTFAPTPARAQTWDGETNTNWDAATNWNPNGLPVAGATVTINNGALAIQPNVNTNQTVAQTNISAGTLSVGATLTSPVAISGTGLMTVNTGGNIVGAITVQNTGAALQLNSSLAGPGSITLNGAGVGGTGALVNLAGSNIVSGAVTLGSAATIGQAAGVLFIDNTVANGGNPLTANAASTGIAFLGVISGTGGFTKEGLGQVDLNAANTYTGVTTVGAGQLTLNNGAAIADTGTVIVNGGALMVFTNETIGSLAGTGGVVATNNAAGATLTVGGGNSTFAGNIVDGNGTFSLVYNGIGTLTLTGANSYTGGTTLQQGALAIGAAGNIGAGAINLNGGQLRATANLALGNTINANTAGSVIDTGANTLTLTGALGGAASFTKSGGGTLVFGSTLNTAGHTGGMTLQAGTLSLQGNLAAGFGTITTTGSVIDYASGTTSAAPININSNTTQLQVLAGNATQSGIISETAGPRPLEKIGDGRLVLSGANTYTGLTTITAGTLRASNNTALGAGAAVVATGATLELTGGVTIGNTLTLNGAGLASQGALSNEAGNNSANGLITLASAATIGSSDLLGTLTLGGAINNGGNALTLSGLGDFVVNGVISGAGDLTKLGAGNTTLNGANTYTGDTRINGGALRLSGGAAIADAGAVIVSAPGVLVLNASETIGSLAGSGFVFLNANTLTTGGNNASTIYSGSMVGTGGLTKTGTGTMTLTGTNNYDGLTNITAGVVTVTNTNGLGSTLGGTVVQNGAALQIQGGINIAGAEALTLNGSGAGGAGALVNTLGNNAFNGSITLASAATIGATSGTLILNGIVGNAGNLLTTTGGGTGRLDFNGVISGAGGLTTEGNIITSLTGANTYAGVTTVNGGNLFLSGGSAIADAGAVVVNAPGVIRIFDNETIGSLAGSGVVTLDANLTAGGNNASTTFSGQLNGAGGLTKLGAGVFTLTGNSIYTGATTVNGGTLQIGAGGTTGAINGASAVSIGAAGTVAVNRSNAVTLANVITGAGTLNQIGAGATTISGNSAAFTGTTNVNVGSLLVTGNIGGTVNVNAGATLGGTGTVGSAGLNTTVLAAGNLSPGLSPGTLNIGGNLVLAAGSNTSFELNTSQQINGVGPTGNDLINVAGNLNVAAGANLNVASTVSGYFRLFNVAGTGAGTATNFAVNAPGFGSSIYTESPSGPNQVNLLLTAPGQSVQFWDGTDFTGGAAGPQGGAGAWNGTNTNWTQPAGVINDFWRQGVGIFGPAPGAVAVTGVQNFQGLQFTADGYSVAGGTLNMTGNPFGNPLASFINTDAGTTTTIASVLSGVGLDKLGAGTLVLTGANTYTGLTDVQAGVLNIQNASALGLGTGVAADGTRVRTGAALELQGGITIANELLFLNGTGIANAGALRNVAGANVWGGPVTLETASQINVDAGSLTINGIIGGGANPLTKAGAGLLTLNGVNTFTGLTTVAAGTLINNGTLPGAVTNNAAFTNNGFAGSLLNNGAAANNGTIGAGVTNNLTFANNAAGIVNGGLANNAGTTTNAGTINGGATNAAGATIVTSNQINGGLTNSGTVQAQGGISGAILNQGAGTITTTGALLGDGAFTNNGASQLNVTAGSFTGITTLTNSSTAAPGVNVGAFTLGAQTIQNNAGAIFTSIGTVNATTSFTNAGTANMAGILNTPTAANSGAFNVTGNLAGPVGAFNNADAGTLAVTGGNFTGIGALTNSSTAATGVNVAAGRTLGTVTILNSLGSTFASLGTVNATTSFTNAGTANFAGLLNTPLFANSGAFTVTGDLGGATTAFNNSSAGALAVTGGNFTGIGALTNSSTAATGVNVAAGRMLGTQTIQNNAGSTFASAGTVNATTSFTNAGLATMRGLLNTPLFSNSGTFQTSAAGLGGATAIFSNTGTTNIGAGDFLGIGSFNNAGTLLAAGGGGRTLGAATFNNQAAGVISQQNGATSDVLTLTGNYSGAAGSRIVQDINLSNLAGGAANGDRIEVAGTASGSTTLAFSQTAEGRAIFATPIPVFRSTGANTLAVNEGLIERRGFFDYFLRRSPGDARQFEVTSQFNSGPASGVAGGISGMISSLQAGFHQPASAIVSRPDNCTPNQLMGGPFIRLSAGETTIKNKSSGDLAGGGSPFTNDTKSTSLFKGFQTGVDFGVCNINNTGWNFHFGVMGGLVDVSSSGRSTSPTPVAGITAVTRTQADADVPFVGAYSFITNGPFTAEMNIRRDFFDVKVSASDATTVYVGPRQKLKGDGLSFNGSLSYRFNFAERFYIEPQVGISKARTSFDLLPFATGGAGDYMRFDTADSLMGRIGLNAGAAFFLTEKFVAVPFVSASVWREFAKPLAAQAVIGSSGQTFLVETDRVGTFGQVGAGVQFRLIDTPFVGFVRGDVRFGSKIDGKAVNAGLRLQF